MPEVVIFSFVLLNDNIFFFIFKTNSYWHDYSEFNSFEVRVFFLTKLTGEEISNYCKRRFSLPSSQHHSFAEVFLVSLIINLMWGERQDFEKASQRKGENAASRQNGHLINHYIPETIKLDFKVVLLRRFKYL